MKLEPDIVSSRETYSRWVIFNPRNLECFGSMEDFDKAADYAEGLEERHGVELYVLCRDEYLRRVEAVDRVGPWVIVDLSALCLILGALVTYLLL